MEHWVYGTDDDEPPNKECWRDDASKQHHAAMKRTSADSRKPDTCDDKALTNAPGDPSWAQLEPHPENARPPPHMEPPKQQSSFAPAAVDWPQEATDDDNSYQDPRLPPGVIDISEELRWRHRERQRQSEWAQRLLARSGLFGAGPMRGPLRPNEPPPWRAAREETTRNHERKANRPPYDAQRTNGRPEETTSSVHAPRPLWLPCSLL